MKFGHVIYNILQSNTTGNSTGPAYPTEVIPGWSTIIIICGGVALIILLILILMACITFCDFICKKKGTLQDSREMELLKLREHAGMHSPNLHSHDKHDHHDDKHQEVIIQMPLEVVKFTEKEMPPQPKPEEAPQPDPVPSVGIVAPIETTVDPTVQQQQ